MIDTDEYLAAREAEHYAADTTEEDRHDAGLVAIERVREEFLASQYYAMKALNDALEANLREAYEYDSDGLSLKEHDVRWNNPFDDILHDCQMAYNDREQKIKNNRKERNNAN